MEIKLPRWVDADVYLFDIDGTLLHSHGGAHYHAFNSALKHAFGVDATIDGIVWHGNTDVGILRAVLEREGVDTSQLGSMIPDVIDHMCGLVESNRASLRAETCSGIPEMIRRLHGRRKLLGVASGNFERIGWIKIEAAGLRQYFDFGSFSDVSEHRSEIFRHAIAEARRRAGTNAKVCIVGDTPADVQAAKLNGVPVIAVATGIFSVQQLQEHAPDLVLGSCAEAFPAGA